MATVTKQERTGKSEKIELVESLAPPIAPEAAPLAWLTVETLLYAVIFAGALALRLWNLGGYPLSGVEAEQGLAALSLYRGDPIEANSYSPLLVSLNALIFLVLHESSATARLASALLGSGLVLLPALLRGHLGRKVSLLAALLLAFSPTAIFLSRTLNSEIAIAGGALMVLAGFFNWAESGSQRWLYLLAGGLALSLTAGPLVYSLLVIFGIIILVRYAGFRALWAQGLHRTETEQPPPAGRDKKRSRPKKSDDEAETRGVHPALRQAGVFFLVALVLLATAATFNLPGLGVATGLLTDWLGRFSFQPRPDAGFNAVFLLTIYEPLLVLAGFVGVAYAILSGSLLRQLFAGWFLGALVLDLVMSGRPTGAIILSLVPLAFLAAIALADLWEGLQARGSWSNEGIILAAGLVIATFGYIGLTGWLVRPCASDDQFCQLAWIQAVAALLLFLIIVGFFWFVAGPGIALRGAAITGVVIGLIATINIGWRLNYGPLRNLAYQPLAGAPASTEVITLANTLASESLIRTGDKTMLDITVANMDDPALAWQLRNYQNVTPVSTIFEAPTSSALITPVVADNDFNLGEAYIGQDLAITASWSPVGLSIKELVNWLIYRQAATQPQQEQVVLWLRFDNR